MEWLEAAPEHSELGPEIGRLRERTKTSPGAVAQVEATIARMDKRFEWGHFDSPEGESEYLRRRADLVRLRQELETEAEPAAIVRLSGIVDAWDTGDATTRHGLLAALFESIEVKRGPVVVGIKPRPEVAAELTRYLMGWPGLQNDGIAIRYA